MSHKLKILLIDDEPAVRSGIRDFLASHGCEVEEADNRRAGHEAFRSRRPDAVVLDYLLPDGDTLELLSRFKETDANVPMLILTAQSSIELAVRAVRQGADQFLTKPVDLSALLLLLRREVDNYRSRRKNRAQQQMEERCTSRLDPFVGNSDVIRRLEEQVRGIQASDSSVLLVGETGTGKGVLAKWLHAHGPRASEPFVDMSCAGFTRELLESELFGHERGAFTGATQARPGLLETGDRGTIFLDEIADMDLQLQPKLLTVIQEKRFRRLGEVRDRRVDIRLIAATHQDLGELVREKKFRGDLYSRINTTSLTVPPLRERKEDIALLANRILQTFPREIGRNAVTLTPEAESALLRYHWPGNIRELRNVLERAVLLCSHTALQPEDLRFEAWTLTDVAAGNPNLTLAELERRHIELMLAQEGGHVERAAGKLGIPRSSLYDKLKRFRCTPSKA